MTLSQVRAYSTTHLTEAAAHWSGLADHRESTFAAVRNRAHTLNWTGDGADALRGHVEMDYRHAVDSANTLRTAANIATTGADDLD